jgi:hypothetical protein
MADGTGGTDTVKQFFTQLVVLAILPIIFAATSWGWWRVRELKASKVQGKAIMQASGKFNTETGLQAGTKARN